MKSDRAARAGYSAESKLQGVAPGEYAVRVLQDTAGVPTIYACGVKRCGDWRMTELAYHRLLASPEASTGTWDALGGG
jgi:hypothetical protein